MPHCPKTMSHCSFVVPLSQCYDVSCKPSKVPSNSSLIDDNAQLSHYNALLSHTNSPMCNQCSHLLHYSVPLSRYNAITVPYCPTTILLFTSPQSPSSNPHLCPTTIASVPQLWLNLSSQCLILLSYCLTLTTVVSYH